MTAEPLEVRIIPAREKSLARINDLIVRSKSYWNWPTDYLKQALPLHEIDFSYLRSNQCFELLDVTDQLAAFLAVAISRLHSGLRRDVPEEKWPCRFRLRGLRLYGR